MSAGSHTEPGGYTAEGQSNLHQTAKGRFQALEPLADSVQNNPRQATRQIDITEHRSPAEMAEVIRSSGYEPVWKDWDAAILKHE